MLSLTLLLATARVSQDNWHKASESYVVDNEVVLRSNLVLDVINGRVVGVVLFLVAVGYVVVVIETVVFRLTVVGGNDVVGDDVSGDVIRDVVGSGEDSVAI